MAYTTPQDTALVYTVSASVPLSPTIPRAPNPPAHWFLRYQWWALHCPCEGGTSCPLCSSSETLH